MKKEIAKCAVNNKYGIAKPGGVQKFEFSELLREYFGRMGMHDRMKFKLRAVLPRFSSYVHRIKLRLKSQTAFAKKYATKYKYQERRLGLAV